VAADIIGQCLVWALDAVSFAEDRLGFIPDPWQRLLLRSQSRWVLLNCCRQSGKSTTTAIVALHSAIYDPGLVLCVSPSLRQSRELFAKIIAFLKTLAPVEPLEEDNKSSCELANGSRIVSLPGDPDTIRGYSAPKLVITDEAAYVSDAMQAALAPMLAVSQGRQIDMSSPNGRRGYFYENWVNGENIERIRLIGRECPRISPEFLEQQRKRLGPMLFAQEFEGEFTDADTSAFSSELVEMALTDDFAPFLPRVAA
jgi:Terminase large subunit, T4likevirus-type, N-terminal